MRVKSPLLRRVFRHVKNMFKNPNDFRVQSMPSWMRKRCKSCRSYGVECFVSPLHRACEKYIKR